MGEQENIMATGGENTAVEEKKNDTGTETVTEDDSASANIGEAGSEDEGDGAEAAATFGDGATGKSEDGDGNKEKPWKNAENAENARRRREQEETRRVEKAKREARTAAILEALEGINPFTNAPMKDESDVLIYETMRQMKAKGLDPVADYPRFKAEQERTAEADRQEAAKQADYYAKDRADFIAKYPQVDLETLIADSDFADYADGKVGRKPLAEIYAGYLRLSEKQSAGARAEAQAEANAAKERAQNAAAQALANAKATPGSAKGEGPAEQGYFTPEQVKAMSKSEIARNLEKIQESMRKWK